MKTFAMAIALLASVNTFAQVVYTDTADLSTSTINHKIVDAQYVEVATSVREERVPGCVVHSENYPENCMRTVVTSSEPVVAVTVAYVDTMWMSEGDNLSYATFNFKTSDFSEADVAALKGKGHFSKAGRNFAAKYFTLQVKKVARKIAIVDVARSTLCTSFGDNYPDTIPGCVENIVYKSATTFVKEVSVITK